MKVDECDEAVHMHAQPLLTKLFCVFVRGQFYSKTSDFAEVEVGTAVGVSMR